MTKKNLDLSPRKQALLDRLMKAEGFDSATPLRIPVRHDLRATGEWPLSFAQQSLWFIDQLDPGNPTYNVANAVRLSGWLGAVALQSSLQEIVRRHEVLRTRFAVRDGQPVQVTQGQAYLAMQLVDLSGLAEAERQQQMGQQLGQEAGRGFDLEVGRLLRATVLRLGEREQVLAVTMHHIISDGWSLEVMVRELADSYEAIRRGRAMQRGELAVQYADYAVWQREYLQGERLEQEMSYWRRELEGLSHLELPSDRPRPAVASHRGASLSDVLPAPVVAKLQELARQEGVTMFMVMLAGLLILLSYYTNQDDIAIGMPTAGRDREETRELIGFFVNTLVMRTKLAGNPTIRELLGRVKKVCTAAYERQDVPFERLVQELQPKRDLSRNPLFQILLASHNSLPEGLTMAGVKIESVRMPKQIAAFDLSCYFTERGESGMEIEMEYCVDLFDRDQMERMLKHLGNTLAWMADHVKSRLDSVGMLDQPEINRIVFEWNDTASEYSTDRCLHDLVTEQSKRSPQAVALVCEESHLSYAEMNRLANKLANYLRSIGVTAESRVGVFLERSVEMGVALLGVLKAGAAYLPLDPNSPSERLKYVIADCQADAIITSLEGLDHLGEASGATVAMETVLSSGSVSHEPSANVVPDNAAYVIYTSGSTGKPKGVVNTHRGIANRLCWGQEAFRLTAQDVVLQKTPFTFDVSIWEIFWPLMVGARLVMARPEGHKDPEYLVDIIGAEHISVIHFVPSMLQSFVQQPALHRCRSLKRVICSGESLSVELKQRLLKKLRVDLHNLYGPTEAAVEVSRFDCSADASDRSVPIGKPIKNVRLNILGMYEQPVPPGVSGELMIGGTALARGYWSQPDLTAERFIPDPFGKEAGSCLYRTGDLARYRPDGNIEYIGRTDQQVKIRGVRIEVGEIESVLCDHPGIKEAAVVPRAYTSTDIRLEAYLVSNGVEKPARHELREYLKARLPESMHPSAYAWLEKLPVTPSGKLDRRALPAQELSREDDHTERVAARTPVERMLERMWTEALRVRQVGVHDNFFDLGGHSLLLIQIAANIQNAFSVSIPVKTLFEKPTIRQQAVAIAAEQVKAADANEVRSLLAKIRRLAPDEVRERLKADAKGGHTEVN